MRLKFSVGVSDERADRSLLERRRQSLRPRGLGADRDRDREQRARGWPAASNDDEETESSTPPHWAW